MHVQNWCNCQTVQWTISTHCVYMVHVLVMYQRTEHSPAICPFCRSGADECCHSCEFRHVYYLWRTTTLCTKWNTILAIWCMNVRFLENAANLFARRLSRIRKLSRMRAWSLLKLSRMRALSRLKLSCKSAFSLLKLSRMRALSLFKRAFTRSSAALAAAHCASALGDELRHGSNALRRLRARKPRINRSNKCRICC